MTSAEWRADPEQGCGLLIAVALSIPLWALIILTWRKLRRR